MNNDGFGFRDRLRHAFPEENMTTRSSSFDNLFDRAFSRFPRPNDPFSFEPFREPEEFYRGGDVPGDQRSSFSSRGFPSRAAPRPFPPRGGGYDGPRMEAPSSMPAAGRYAHSNYDSDGQGQDSTDGYPPEAEPQEPRYSQQMPRQEKNVKIEVEPREAPQPSRKYFTNIDPNPRRSPNPQGQESRFQQPSPKSNVAQDIPIPMPPPESHSHQPKNGAPPKPSGNKSAKLHVKTELDPPSPNPIPMPGPPLESCVIKLGDARYAEPKKSSQQSQESKPRPQASPNTSGDNKEAKKDVKKNEQAEKLQLKDLQSPPSTAHSQATASTSRKMSRQASIGEIGDKIITMLDEIERRVEKLRETASLLEDEKRQLQDMLNTVDRNKDMLSPSGAKEDIEAITSRLLKRCGAVDVSVRTPRNESQAEALQAVNKKVDDLLHLMRENITQAHDTCLRYLNASCPDQPDGPIDQRFQSMLIDCTADDQKRVRQRLNQILQLIQNPPKDDE